MQSAAAVIAGVRKSFGRNIVLKGIDMSVPKGQVTVLMGANGAGKSTLVKILSGVHAADAGEITLLGDPYVPETPAQAMRSGVVTVHQSINDGVIPDLDVASNLMLDRLAESGGGFFLKSRQIRRQAREVAASIGLEVDVSAAIAELSLADRQLVAIARAMAHRPRLLILDEPTSSLSAAEADRLFRLIDRFRDDGVGILYISHRMSDIRRIADRIVTMRDGQISGTFESDPLDYEGAVQAMLGHKMTDVHLRIPEAGAPVLSLRDFRLNDVSAPFSLQLRDSEVVAVTGLVGSGKSQLAEILFGTAQPHSGTMQLAGRSYAPANPEMAIRAGVFLCPKDRASNAVIGDFDISGNTVLPFFINYSALSFLNRSKIQAVTRDMIEDLGIVCQSERDAIGTLSGGNQQKVMVARWLSETCKLLVLDEPFQGVDIKARRDIGQKIRETAGDRATVVMVAELDEALEIADRIVVMSAHTVVGDHRNENIDIGPVLSQVAGQGSEAVIGLR